MRLLTPLLLIIFLTSCKPTNPPAPVVSPSSITLTSSKGVNQPSPTDSQIRAALTAIHGDEEGFAVLKRSDMMYIQVASHGAGTFFLEYQEGDLQSHFVSDRNDFSLDEVVRAFIQYRDESINWPDYGSWSQLKM